MTAPSPEAVGAPEAPARAAIVRVARALKRAARAGDDPRPAHQLRTSVRRAEAALDAFESLLDPRPLRKARKALQRIRRAAGPARDADVHLRMLREYSARAPREILAATAHAIERLQEVRSRASRRLRDRAEADPPRRLKRLARRLPAAAGDQTLARRTLDPLRAELERSAAQAPHDPESLHTVRVLGKRLRYTVELFVPALPGSHQPALDALRDLQDLLGRVNDARTLADRLVGFARDAAPGMAEPLALLAHRFAILRGARLREAIHRLQSPAGPLPRLRAALAALVPDPPAAPACAPTFAHPRRSPRRLAAIDVGTNSIRLIVAEAHEGGVYRVLDDERDAARLGAGLGRTGAMSPESIARAADAVDRMRRIAEGHRAQAIRVVGTSACREASNTHELAKAILRRTGLTLDVIPADEEGRLAFISAAHAFDLRDAPAAVIDIGGGSTEVVLSAAGAVERICSLPLGAVRLTERFGGPARAAADRYEKMRRHIRRALRRGVGSPDLHPQTVIGTGGTFTTLAAILMHREYGPAGPSLWNRGVPGHQVKRAELRHVLDWLRRLSPQELARVPGLPAERADIIVAGLTIAERALKHLGANVVHVHDRGIRDGIIISMAADLFAARGPAGEPDRPDPMVAVRRFAETCRYEAAHSEHVASLALSIHDQLAAALGADDPWASPAARRLLHAAGVLHDIGYLVNYSKHHRHSYHLILHSGLSGLSPREVEVIANLAFYHRQAEPSRSHPNFAALSRPDQELVRRLTAVLRIADGLDRTHTQQVRAVRVRVNGSHADFVVAADEEPGTDLWGAERKSGLFREMFGLSPRFFFGPEAIRDATVMERGFPACEPSLQSPQR